MEEVKEKKDLLLLSAANALKRKAEETKQDMNEARKNISVNEKKAKKYLSYLRTVVHHLYGCFIFIQILLVFVFGVKVTHTGGASIWIQACLGDFGSLSIATKSIWVRFFVENDANYRFILRKISSKQSPVALHVDTQQVYGHITRCLVI